MLAGVAFEIEHRVDHVLDHARPGDLPVLGDVADEHDRRAARLGVADQRLRRGAHLRNRARRAFGEIGPQRLDGIDHDEIDRRTGLQRGEDVLDTRLGGERRPAHRGGQGVRRGAGSARSPPRRRCRRRGARPARARRRPGSGWSICRCRDRRRRGSPSPARCRRRRRGRTLRCPRACAAARRWRRRAASARPACRGRCEAPPAPTPPPPRPSCSIRRRPRSGPATWRRRRRNSRRHIVGGQGAPSGGLRAVDVDAGGAVAEARQKLVADRVRRRARPHRPALFGPKSSTQSPSTTPTMPLTSDGHQIHRNPPQKRRRPAAHQNATRRGARCSIRRAGGIHRHSQPREWRSACLLQGAFRRCSRRLAGRRVAHLHDPRLGGDDGRRAAASAG